MAETKEEVFTREEQDFIDAFNALKATKAKSVPLIEIMAAYAAEILEEDSIIKSLHNAKFLLQFHYSPDIVTELAYYKSPPKCPSCKEFLIGNCGLLECKKCGKKYFLENEHTFKQCLKCARYFENMTALDVYTGRGSGCAGVKGKGNQLKNGN